MSHTDNRPESMEQLLRARRLAGTMTAPRNLEDEIMRAVRAQRMLTPPRLIDHLPIPSLVLLSVLIAIAVALWIDGTFLSLAGMIHGQLAAMVVAPSGIMLAYVSMVFAAISLLLLAMTLTILALSSGLRVRKNPLTPTSMP